MATAIWKPGRRLFTTAAVLMIFTCIAHTLGNSLSGPRSPGEREVFAAMDAFHVGHSSSMNPSFSDIYWGLIYIMSITFAALGVLNLILSASPDVPRSVLRRISIGNAIWLAAFILLTWHYQIPPALISGVVIEIFVLADLLLNRTQAGIAQAAAS